MRAGYLRIERLRLRIARAIEDVSATVSQIKQQNQVNSRDI
jgi:hypothetical protein